jgi:hypothetical protein
MSHGTGGSYVHDEIRRKMKYVPAFCQGDSVIITKMLVTNCYGLVVGFIEGNFCSCGL